MMGAPASTICDMRCHTTQTFRQPASLEGILAHIDNSTTTVYAAEAQYQSQQTPVNIPRESQPSSTLPKPKGTPTTKRAGVKAAHGMPNSHKSRKAARDERKPSPVLLKYPAFIQACVLSVIAAKLYSLAQGGWCPI